MLALKVIQGCGKTKAGLCLRVKIETEEHVGYQSPARDVYWAREYLTQCRPHIAEIGDE